KQPAHAQAGSTVSDAVTDRSRQPSIRKIATDYAEVIRTAATVSPIRRRVAADRVANVRVIEGLIEDQVSGQDRENGGRGAGDAADARDDHVIAASVGCRHAESQDR